MVPFYGWGSTTSRLQPLRGDTFAKSSGRKQLKT